VRLNTIISINNRMNIICTGVGRAPARLESGTCTYPISTAHRERRCELPLYSPSLKTQTERSVGVVRTQNTEHRMKKHTLLLKSALLLYVALVFKYVVIACWLLAMVRCPLHIHNYVLSRETTLLSFTYPALHRTVWRRERRAARCLASLGARGAAYLDTTVRSSNS
jgi:hypothetical protein